MTDWKILVISNKARPVPNIGQWEISGWRFKSQSSEFRVWAVMSYKSIRQITDLGETKSKRSFSEIGLG